MIQIAELINKIKRYNNISVYNRKNRLLPHIDGGIGAFGQDVFIAELLNHKKNGVFLDVGANDGVSINNSLYFEKHYDWTGIAVEPVAYIFKKLKANRKCHVVQGCVSHRQGPAKFIQLIGDANMFSTLKSHNTGLTARRVRKRQKRQNSELKEIEVECFTISDLTRKFGYKNVDFLSLDTEGGELEILKSIDFAETPITAISVENNWRTPHIRNYLEECGYIYIGTFGVDEIYLFGGNGLREAVKR
ncbi:MAG: FkbM family methyltransferase [Desulfopila sp.]